MRAATKRRLRFFISVLAFIATGGALLGSVLGRAPLVGALVSAIDASLVLGTIAAAEIFLPQTRLGRALEGAPFLFTLVVKWLAYYALIVIEIGGRLGRHLVTAALIGGDPTRVVAQQPPRVPLRAAMMILALFVPACILLIQLSRLIGERTLGDIRAAATIARAPRNGSFFSSTSPAQHRLPSASVLPRSIVSWAGYFRSLRSPSTTIAARFTSTSATRS